MYKGERNGMNKAFEKILDGIESLKSNKGFGGTIQTMYADGMLDKAKQIVQEVAEEYNSGWIPCSERLPEDFMSMEYLTTVKGHFYSEINYYCVANHKWFSSRKTTKEVDVIAWQPLPEPYKES